MAVAFVVIKKPWSAFLFALFAGSIALRYGIGSEAVELGLFGYAVFAAALIDAKSFVIPNGCIVVCIVVRLAYVGALALGGCDVRPVLAESLAGAAAVLAIFAGILIIAGRLFGRAGIGGGDIKLFAACGLYFGFERTLFLIVAACLIGLAWALLSPAQGNRMERAFPFAPSIAIATWACMLV